jgi:hypothetical protein
MHMKKKQTNLLVKPEDEINRLHKEVMTRAKMTLVDAMRIGELLTNQRVKLDHGEWLPWIEKHLEFSQRTAYNYMNAFARADEIKKLATVANLKQLNLKDIYRNLSDESPPKPKPQASVVPTPSWTAPDIRPGPDGWTPEALAEVDLNTPTAGVEVDDPPPAPTPLKHAKLLNVVDHTASWATALDRNQELWASLVGHLANRIEGSKATIISVDMVVLLLTRMMDQTPLKARNTLETLLLNNEEYRKVARDFLKDNESL